MVQNPVQKPLIRLYEASRPENKSHPSGGKQPVLPPTRSVVASRRPLLPTRDPAQHLCRAGLGIDAGTVARGRKQLLSGEVERERVRRPVARDLPWKKRRT